MPHYTTDAAASDALDDAILKKLAPENLVVWFDGENYWMMSRNADAKHPDKKICRALFAQKLFKE